MMVTISDSVVNNIAIAIIIIIIVIVIAIIVIIVIVIIIVIIIIIIVYWIMMIVKVTDLCGYTSDMGAAAYNTAAAAATAFERSIITD